MPIIEPAIRPPSEADSFLLQVTMGCSSNGCTFCGAYLGKPFRMKELREVLSDLEEGGRLLPETRRVFLMDGDALALSNERLIPILEKIQSTFPQLTRIASYANGYNIVRRSREELKALREAGLRLIYIGLESGSQKVLDRCRKRSTAEEMIQAVRSAEEAGIKSSVIVLLGLGGREFSAEHVRETVTALNQMAPKYLSFLSLMLVPGTPLSEEADFGHFEELDSQELLREALGIVQGLELQGTIFRMNHASNYLPLEGRFPQDKAKICSLLRSAVDGKVRLRPEFFRGL